MQKRLKAIKSILVEYKGKLQLMERAEYLRILRNEESEIPKLIGTVDPYDKTGLRWEKEPEAKEITYNHNWSAIQAQRLENLIIVNIDYLANKSPKVFVNNFNQTIMKNIRKNSK